MAAFSMVSSWSWRSSTLKELIIRCMLFIITLNCAVIKKDVAEVKAERLDIVDAVVCGTLVEEEATTVDGGNTVTFVVVAEVDIVNQLIAIGN